MKSPWKWGWEVLKFATSLQSLLHFADCSFLWMERLEAQNWSFFCGCNKCMATDDVEDDDKMVLWYI